MLKTYFNEKSGCTTAVVTDSDMDAIQKAISKLELKPIFNDSVPEIVTQSIIRALSLSKLVMPSTNKATVKVHGSDEFDEDIGVQEATAKVRENYRRSLKKSFERWQVAMLKKVYNVNPETFRDATQKAMLWIDKHEENIKQSKEQDIAEKSIE